MACVNWVRSSTTAILHLFSKETDILIKVIMKFVNIKLWDILGCFHYILNPPRTSSGVYMYKLMFLHNNCKQNMTSLSLLVGTTVDVSSLL